ncbi:MAG TPA: 1,2-phenylacetyl-CoA epoxidase subunit PaaD [Nocardioidaceae bacterium]|nr:1,2-phenylacetyl-CoA epoxidase subunit PaaD [Nocardioidaceae bacterium]
MTVSTGSTTRGVSTGSTTRGVSTGSTTRGVSTGSTTRGVSTGSTTRKPLSRAEAWAIAATVPDPEVPVVSIEDLGILRAVEVDESGHVDVAITPTYSGCPAMEAIRADIGTAFAQAGYDDVSVEFVLSPAWTTDWMTEAGRTKLEAYGIAPPRRRATGSEGATVSLTLSVRCPQCGSPDTHELSRFGSTACKALWVCDACKEPFDHFKAI